MDTARAMPTRINIRAKARGETGTVCGGAGAVHLCVSLSHVSVPHVFEVSKSYSWRFKLSTLKIIKVFAIRKTEFRVILTKSGLNLHMLEFICHQFK